MRSLSFSAEVEGREQLRADKLYAYSDETVIESRSSGVPRQLIGAAALVTAEPVPQAVVDLALTFLEQDPDRSRPDRKQNDDRTLARHSFHASDDSANGHSHLACSIRNHVRGVLSYSVYDPCRFQLGRRTQNARELQNSALFLSAHWPMNGVKSIELSIEARDEQGELGDPWIERIYSSREWGIYDTPWIPVYFPRLTVVVGTKACPGLQVVDFLLWALNRRYQDESDPWAIRAGMGTDHLFREASGPLEGGTFSVGRVFVELPLVRYPEAILPVPDLASPTDARDALLIIEHSVRQVIEDVPETVQHFASFLENLEMQLTLEPARSDERIVELLASAYLRIFDTVPLYAGLSETDVSAWHRLLRARRIASLVLRKDRIEGTRTLDYLVELRRRLCATSPSLLLPGARY
jgi:hypothetical protein